MQPCILLPVVQRRAPWECQPSHRGWDLFKLHDTGTPVDVTSPFPSLPHVCSHIRAAAMLLLLTLSYVFVTFLFFTVDIPPPWCFTHALLAVLFCSLGLFYFYSSWRYSHRKSLTLVSYIAFARRCIHTSDGISTSIRYCYYMLVRFSIDKIGSLNVTASATHTSPSIAFRDFNPDQTS